MWRRQASVSTESATSERASELVEDDVAEATPKTEDPDERPFYVPTGRWAHMLGHPVEDLYVGPKICPGAPYHHFFLKNYVLNHVSFS